MLLDRIPDLFFARLCQCVQIDVFGGYNASHLGLDSVPLFRLRRCYREGADEAEEVYGSLFRRNLEAHWTDCKENLALIVSATLVSFAFLAAGFGPVVDIDETSWFHLNVLPDVEVYLFDTKHHLLTTHLASILHVNNLGS